MVIFIDRLGVGGVLIAPPAAVALQILFDRILEARAEATKAKQAAADLVDLTRRVEDLEVILATQPAEPSPRMKNMMERLHKLVQEANEAVEGM